MAEELIVKPITEAVTVAPAPTETKEETTEQAAPPEPAPVVEETKIPEEEPEPKESKVVKELKEQRRKRQDAERDAAYWRGIAEGKKPVDVTSPTVQPSPTQEPRIEQYEKYDDFLVAKAEWNVEQKAKVRSFQEEEAAAQEAFNARIEKFAEIDPDISSIVNDQTLPISTPMAAVIRRSENGPMLLRYLSNNRQEALRISRLTPLAAAMEIGRLEMKITSVPKTEVKKVSQAPNPIQTVKPTATGPVDEDALPVEDWITKRNHAQYKVRR